MSARSNRGRAAVDALPGMPDILPKIPPKATEYAALTLGEAIARAHEILDRALDRHPNPRVFGLFSGGGDSSILAHLMRDRVEAFIHVDTGISVKACGVYVRAIAEAWGLPLHVAKPDDTYDDLVLGNVRNAKGEAVHVGFPGPAAHALMYTRLKERALDKFRRDRVAERGRVRGAAGELVFIAGMRWGESERRFRNASELDPDGAITWCSPIVWWTDAHMAEYRARHLCHDNHEHAPHRLCRPDALPLSEVTEHLHMSGDCLCGAYARPGELDEIAFFYPEDAAPIRALECRARAAGIAAATWGERPPGDDEPIPAEPVGRLCSSCIVDPRQASLVDTWLADGLISPDFAAQLGGTADQGAAA